VQYGGRRRAYNVRVLATMYTMYVYWLQCIQCTCTGYNVYNVRVLATMYTMYVYWLQCIQAQCHIWPYMTGAVKGAARRRSIHTHQRRDAASTHTSEETQHPHTPAKRRSIHTHQRRDATSTHTSEETQHPHTPAKRRSIHTHQRRDAAVTRTSAGGLIQVHTPAAGEAGAVGGVALVRVLAYIGTSGR
jgi:hypothetical protein